MGKNKLYKALRKCVRDLPPVMQDAVEVHTYTGPLRWMRQHNNVTNKHHIS